ncbi:Predicted amidohydrolase [Seinonella peptonophila]|uniref:Predicted amidohydrolase n=1 Tax=Seinonella peptonophila TaxID=112248 RepID=A0A1M4YDT6_9BACL|nr:carbon-nitrogen hydrolase family protein [Seinonella peptonophila]SHF03920.1 Predicted amidohydrolase [Seinonella peptonophila]
MKIYVAAVQMSATPFKKAEKWRQMAQWIKKIKQARPSVQLIIFPELAVTGYDFQLCYRDLAEERHGETYQFFSQLAQQYGIYLVYGNVEQNQGKSPFNTIYFMNPQGQVTQSYHKTHLTSLERSHFTAGDALQTVETEWGKVGLLICWDLAFPEVARSHALDGVDLLIAPAAWEKPYLDSYVKFSMARALDNATPLVTCNYIGKNHSFDFTGGSRIFDATGTEMVSLVDEEDYLYAEIDSTQTNKARQEFYTMLMERKPELYKRGDNDAKSDQDC